MCGTWNINSYSNAGQYAGTTQVRKKVVVQEQKREMTGHLTATNGKREAKACKMIKNKDRDRWRKHEDQEQVKLVEVKRCKFIKTFDGKIVDCWKEWCIQTKGELRIIVDGLTVSSKTMCTVQWGARWWDEKWQAFGWEHSLWCIHDGKVSLWHVIKLYFLEQDPTFTSSLYWDASSSGIWQVLTLFCRLQLMLQCLLVKITQNASWRGIGLALAIHGMVDGRFRWC